LQKSLPFRAGKALTGMTYAQFWLRYLKAHADPRTRALHYLGSGAGMILLITFAATRDWPLLIAAPIIGYACAWFGHFVFEHNKPETFGHPLWSLYSDFRMLALFIAGRLSAELRRINGVEREAT
jgi:hypothetical protein